MCKEISIGTSSVASNACRGRGCHPGALVSLPGRESCESVEVLVEGSEGLGRLGKAMRFGNGYVRRCADVSKGVQT